MGARAPPDRVRRPRDGRAAHALRGDDLRRSDDLGGIRRLSNRGKPRLADGWTRAELRRTVDARFRTLDHDPASDTWGSGATCDRRGDSGRCRTIAGPCGGSARGGRWEDGMSTRVEGIARET